MLDRRLDRVPDGPPTAPSMREFSWLRRGLRFGVVEEDTGTRAVKKRAVSVIILPQRMLRWQDLNGFRPSLPQGKPARKVTGADGVGFIALGLNSGGFVKKRPDNRSNSRIQPFGSAASVHWS